VTVFTTVIVTFVLAQLSMAVGVSNDHAVPHSTVLLVEQRRTGGVVSTTLTTWLQVALLVQPSASSQVRTAVKVLPHAPSELVTVLSTRIVTVVPPQASVAVGESKVHGVPHSMVLPIGQITTGVVVSTTATI
jgi:hypothetical protein